MYEMTSPSSMHETGDSKPMHWDNPGDVTEREVGGEFRIGDTCTPMADSCRCMAKTITIL